MLLTGSFEAAECHMHNAILVLYIESLKEAASLCHKALMQQHGHVVSCCQRCDGMYMGDSADHIFGKELLGSIHSRPAVHCWPGSSSRLPHSLQIIWLTLAHHAAAYMV